MESPPEHLVPAGFSWTDRHVQFHALLAPTFLAIKAWDFGLRLARSKDAIYNSGLARR